MDKKITILSVLKQFKNFKIRQSYILFTLLILTFGLLATYLSYTDYSIFGVLILFFIMMPLFVIFAEHIALVERGHKPPTSHKIYLRFYKYTFQSGRMNHFISIKRIILFLLYLTLGFGIYMLGLYVYIYIAEPSIYASVINLIDQILATSSPEIVNDLTTQLIALFDPFKNISYLVNQILLMSGFIYLTIKGYLAIFIDIFVEHRPTTKYKEIVAGVFNNKDSAPVMRNHPLVLSLVLSFVYAAIIILSYFGLSAFSNSVKLFLQIDLIGLIFIMLLFLMVVYYQYYLSQKLIEKNKISSLNFSISELKQMITVPQLDENTRRFIIELIKERENELVSSQKSPTIEDK